MFFPYTGHILAFIIDPYIKYFILLLSLLSVNSILFISSRLNMRQIKYLFLYLFVSLSKIYLAVSFFYWNKYQELSSTLSCI